MRLVRYETAASGPTVGLLTARGVLPTAQTDMIGVIASGRVPDVTGPAISDFRLLAPVPRPGKIFGSGINYAGHREENPEAVMPKEPGFFSKFPSSVCGPGDPVRLATPGSMVDYEVELAVVIGRPGRDIERDMVPAHIFGYTVINDVSDRGVQFRPEQKVLGKGFDSFCPMGPALVTPDEIADLSSCTVRSTVNGELRQNAKVGDMLFDVATLISHPPRTSPWSPAT